MMIVFGVTQRSRSKLDEVAKNQVRRARLIGAYMGCKKLKKAVCSVHFLLELTSNSLAMHDSVISATRVTFHARVA